MHIGFIAGMVIIIITGFTSWGVFSWLTSDTSRIYLEKKITLKNLEDVYSDALITKVNYHMLKARIRANKYGYSAHILSDFFTRLEEGE